MKNTVIYWSGTGNTAAMGEDTKIFSVDKCTSYGEGFAAY